jgi:hypothetical protein
MQGRRMAGPAAEAAGGPVANAGPAPVVLSWPLPGCRPDSLPDLFSARALAELARVAGPAGGAAVLELGGHVLKAPAGGKPKPLQLPESGAPPVGLRSLALRNGTLALRPWMWVEFASSQPFAVSLERIKVTRPAPVGGTGAHARAALQASRAARQGLTPGVAMVVFGGAVSGRMVQCRVELCPVGPAGDSELQTAIGISLLNGTRVVLEDVDVVGRQGAGRSRTVACISSQGSHLALNRCGGGEGWGEDWVDACAAWVEACIPDPPHLCVCVCVCGGGVRRDACVSSVGYLGSWLGQVWLPNVSPTPQASRTRARQTRMAARWSHATSISANLILRHHGLRHACPPDATSDLKRPAVP